MWDQKKTEQIAGLEKTTGLGEKNLYCGRSVVVFFKSLQLRPPCLWILQSCVSSKKNIRPTVVCRASVNLHPSFLSHSTSYRPWTYNARAVTGSG